MTVEAVKFGHLRPDLFPDSGTVCEGRTPALQVTVRVGQKTAYGRVGSVMIEELHGWRALFYRRMVNGKTERLAVKAAVSAYNREMAEAFGVKLVPDFSIWEGEA